MVTTETHLSTCETYKRDECKFITTKLTDIKTHLDENHEQKSNIQIINSKQNRVNTEEFDSHNYAKENLSNKTQINELSSTGPWGR